MLKTEQKTKYLTIADDKGSLLGLIKINSDLDMTSEEFLSQLDDNFYTQAWINKEFNEEIPVTH